MLNDISSDIDPGRNGIEDIITNGALFRKYKYKTTIHFPEPLTKLKLFFCGIAIGPHKLHYQSLQV
jgi:hypothetical protein